MNVFADSNLEALAYNCVSFGFFTMINNLWTWAAVITAAVSLWKMRTAGLSTPDITLKQPNTVDELPIRSSADSAFLLASGDVHGDDDIAVMKGRFKFFSTYYMDEQEGSEDLTAEEENDIEVVEGCGEWWDQVLRMKMGDMGWYRYQDLTELNGNVVRLWDGCRGVKKTYCAESCVVW